MPDLKSNIEKSNQDTVDILLQGQPVWVRDALAKDVVPGLTDNTIMHAGPPIEWERMASAMKKAILGAVVFEGLAEGLEEAEQAVVSDDIQLAPCHQYAVVGGMTGVTSPSMYLHVVKNEAFGNEAYCMPHEGGSFKGLAWGTNDEETLTNVRWMQEELSPVLDAAVQSAGGVNVRQLVARALQMGDECHSRCTAGTSLLTRQLAPHIIRTDFPADVLDRVFTFLHTNDIFFLHIIMAAGRAIVDPAKNIPYSTIVTTLARNGVDFGIKVSSLGEEWFTAPSPKIKTAFFSSKWDDSVATPDMGDSSITETIGLGGQVTASAVAHEHLLGGDFSTSLEKTRNAYETTYAEHSEWLVPNLDFRGTPLGIDIRKVLSKGIEPTVHTATAHVQGGFIGGGEAYVPMETFELAMRAFAEKYQIDQDGNNSAAT